MTLDLDIIHCASPRMDHFTITTSSGRRVSLLSDDDIDHRPSCGSSPTMPIAPNFLHRSYHASLSWSSCPSKSPPSSSASCTGSRSPQRPISPPSSPLLCQLTLDNGPLDKLPPVRERLLPPLSLCGSRPTIPIHSTWIHDNAAPAPISQPSLDSMISNPPSSKSSSPTNPLVKFHYICHSGKSSTASSTMDRHSRIHKGPLSRPHPTIPHRSTSIEYKAGPPTSQTSLDSTNSNPTSSRSSPLLKQGIKCHFMCYCGQSFAASGNFHRHTRIHTGEKKYVCQDCGARFNRPDNCTEHWRTHQRGDRRRRNVITAS